VKLNQALLAAALIWAAVFLPGLGSTELKGEEARRVLPGRNMLMTGEWVVPHIAGRPYSRKPPLINWLAAASFKVTGVQNGWTARAPSVLAVLALGLGVVAFGARWMGAGTALAAAVFVMTNLAILEKGRLAEIEPLYITLSGLAFVSWSAFWVGERSPWLTYTVPWLFLGIAFLAKGPVHLPFFYLPVLATLLFSRRLKELFRLPHFAGLGLMVLTFLPWAVANKRKLAGLLPDDEQPDKIWLTQLTSRLDFSGVPITKYLLTPFEGVVNYLPWALPLLVLWWWASRKQRWAIGQPGERAWARGCAWGTALAYLVVALVPGSLARYTHPAVVPVSLLLAHLLVGAELAPVGQRILMVWKLVLRVLVWCVMGATIVVPVVAVLVFDRTPLWLPLLAGMGAAFLLYVVSRRLLERNDIPSRVFVSSGLFAVAVILYALHVIPIANAEDDVRPLGRKIQAALPAGSELCVVSPGIQPFLFYLDPPYTVVAKLSQTPDTTTHLLMRTKSHEKVKQTPRFLKLEAREMLVFEDKRGVGYRLFEKQNRKN